MKCRLLAFCCLTAFGTCVYVTCFPVYRQTIIDANQLQMRAVTDGPISGVYGCCTDPKSPNYQIWTNDL